MRPRRTPAASPLPLWAGGLGGLALCFLTLPLAFMLGRVDWAALASTLATDEAVNEYPIALVSASTKKDYGQKWIDLVLSEEGQALLDEAGFTPAVK